MPDPSRMVRIWLAGTLVKRSIFWVVGHLTSMRSMTVDLPRPKWRRRSDWDKSLFVPNDSTPFNKHAATGLQSISCGQQSFIDFNKAWNLLCKHEVAGSIPVTSTNFFPQNREDSRTIELTGSSRERGNPRLFSGRPSSRADFELAGSRGRCAVTPSVPHELQLERRESANHRPEKSWGRAN